MNLFEQERYDYGNLLNVAGVDEAGRGPLAGPVVAASVILPKDFSHSLLNDSKKVTKKNRDILYDDIVKSAICYGISMLDNEEIDRLNILQASLNAMVLAIEKMKIPPTFCLLDGNKLPQNLSIPAQAIVKGDSKYASISAASILAKVTRDRYMEELHEKYPCYNFKKNKGYPTKEHFEAIQKYGICPYHRKSFKPVMEYVFKF